MKPSTAIAGSIRRWLHRVVVLTLMWSLAAFGAEQELVFLTWADYIDPGLVAEFEQAEGVKVRFVYFESDFIRNEILVQTDARGFDLASVDGGSIGALANRGWLAPVSEREVPNLTRIDPDQRNAYERAAQYGVPYTWGTLGIAYRADMVSRPPTRWMDLFRPESSLDGRILMIQDPRELIGMALKALGYSANSEHPEELAAAERLLKEQRPHVKSYSYISLSEDSSLVSGETAAAMIYNGDALMLQQYNPQIRFVLPREGGGIWVDYLVVMAASPRKALAARFIDFLNQPENAARNAAFVFYATPNLAAERLLPASFLNDPRIYPDPVSLERSEHYMTRLSPAGIKARQSIYYRLVR